MKLRLAALAGTVLTVLTFIAVSAADDDPPPPEGVQVQARGPVHEAYAEAGDAVASPGALATKQPPDLIEEVPPEEKPEGDNVTWIPGYWAWDEEDANFLWVSGFWRAVPPGRVWIPGHWQEVSDGWAWAAGYWTDEREAADVEYLPPPPESVEAGPSVPAPAADYLYSPGCWLYSETRYAWRPGFWYRNRPGWLWVSDCYKWTPAGYVYVNGYWDVPLAERGLLFAPCRFTDGVYARRGFVYRPSYIVQPDFLLGAMFVRTGTRSYYFGDYFAEGYRRRYVPWVDHRVARDVYDVNYAYYRHSFASQPTWDRGLHGLYEARYRGDVARPPATYAQQTVLVRRLNARKTAETVVNKTVNITNIQNVSVLAPVRSASTVQVTALARLAGPDAVDRTKPKTIRVEKVSKEVITQERRQAEHFRTLVAERRTVEAKVARSEAPTKGPVRHKFEAVKSAPPRKLKAPAAPPPPERPKASVKDPPRGKEAVPPKDRDKVPPPSKDRAVPKDREKTPPPAKDREKAPPPDKDKVVPPKDRDKPPPPPKAKDVAHPPPRPKDLPHPPAKPKDVEHPPAKPKDSTPPPRPKDVTPPPPKPKDVTPPPPKPKAPPPPPKPKDKDKDKD